MAIVALDDRDRVLLVRQFRPAAGRTLLEIPAGGLDAGPGGTIEDPAVAAARELAEETGQRAADWRHLGSFWPAPGFSEERLHLYLATGLTEADGRHRPDADEALALVRLPVENAIAAAEDGRIADAKSIIGLLWLARLRATVSPAARSTR